MKLERGLQSTHDLKKTTYRMLRKLHSLEYRGALQNTQKIGNNYCVLLYLNRMSEVIAQSYNDCDIVHELCNQIDILAISIKKQNRVYRPILVDCLKKHTHVFNWLENNHITVKLVDNEVCETWTMRCITSYVCQFKNDI